MANYFRGGALTRDQTHMKVLIPVSGLRSTERDSALSTERSGVARSASQTDRCTSYEFGTADGHQYSIIDTPGLADTKGDAQDSRNLDAIVEHVSKLTQLSALILVINGSESRETIGIETSLTRLRAACPDRVMSNLLVALTNTDSTGSNFDLQTLCRFGRIPAPHLFVFNNKFFRDGSCAWTDDDVRTQLGPVWRASMDSLDALRKAVHALVPLDSRDFVAMREYRSALRLELAAVLAEISKLDLMRQQLEVEKTRQDNALAGSASSANFTRDEIIVEWTQEATRTHNTVCMVHKSNCHAGCSLDEVGTKGHDSFKGCAAMQGKDHTCTVCPDACPWSDHEHARSVWRKTSKTVQQVLQDVKATHEAYVREAEEAGVELSTHERNLALLEHVLHEKTQGIRDLATQLMTLCSGVVLADELGCVLRSIKLSIRNLTNNKAREAAEQRMAELDTLIQQLQPTPAAAAAAAAPAAARPNGSTAKAHTSAASAAAPKRQSNGANKANRADDADCVILDSSTDAGSKKKQRK